MYVFIFGFLKSLQIAFSLLYELPVTHRFEIRNVTRPSNGDHALRTLLVYSKGAFDSFIC